MGQYDFQSIEKKWQARWKTEATFKAEPINHKPKFYVLDMFPYPSGAGLHVGHPLGYIATDIVARYKWAKGFNVMHPMGYDAFGLPAEQYAIETGTHPAITTERNIERYQAQLEKLGLAYDPETTDMKTCDPSYYKWTQWIFLKIYHSWFNLATQKAEPIETLVARFKSAGNEYVQAYTSYPGTFTAGEWNMLTDSQQQQVLLEYRLAYVGTTLVNWCPELGTVLANDEVINGRSERGNHPVERVPMRQWMFRMTAYADRLLSGLDTIDWPEPLKEQQKNWIGRSEGASIRFEVDGHLGTSIEVFTTRPDTLFGSTFMVIAPEHELVSTITTDAQRAEIEEYVSWAKNRTEVERQQEAKKVTGVFTGAYANHPFSGKKLPIWTADYVLAGYGTGAIMAVPAHDSRDWAFARHFNLEIIPVYAGGNIEEAAYEDKVGPAINSAFLNGLEAKDAIRRMIDELVAKGLGKGRVNYRLRDPNFSRQRYWGEPFPIVFREGVPYALSEDQLPVTLPEVDSYQPSGSGESPLSGVAAWVELPDGSRRETNTMPGYAGSSWYFLRYLDPKNDQEFVRRDLADYWMGVDLYVGGSEHAVGHLLYSRFWTKVLFDLGFVGVDEPFQKLVNQGMIQGRSSLAYRIKGENRFVSKGLAGNYDVDPIHVDVNIVDNDILDLDKFRAWREEYQGAEFVLEDGKFLCDSTVEKMSKRYHNVVNPDLMCEKYGADTFRLYEMFLGPLELSKPFDLRGIEGSAKFLRRLWNQFTDEENNLILTEGEGTPEELKALHQAIKKVTDDIERLSFNTTVAEFMKFMNEMTRLGCHKRSILEPFLILLAPYSPHFAEELWEKMGHGDSILKAPWPVHNEEYLKEDSFEYPVQVNGKVKAKVALPLEMDKEAVEAAIRASAEVHKALGETPIKKVIVVHGRIVNVVI